VPRQHQVPCKRSSIGLFASKLSMILLLSLVYSSLLPSVAAQAAPRSVSVVLVSEITVSLSWEAVADALAYMVQKSTNSVGPFENGFEVRSAPGVVASSTAIVPGLVTGRTMFFRVLPGDDAGNYNSAAASDVVSGTPTGPPKLAVTNVDVVSYNATAVTLSWELPGVTADSGPMPTIFSVQYSCANAPFARYPVEFTGTTGTIIAAGGVPMDQTCKFVIGSRNLNYYTVNAWAPTTVPAGLNQFSAEFSYNMASLPGAVVSLQATSTTLSSITVQWQAAPRALMYRTLYAQVLSNGVFGRAVEVSRDQTTRASTISALTLGTTYLITVESRNR
jgi:hypothetical protein